MEKEINFPKNYEDIPKSMMPIKEQLNRIEAKLDRVISYIDRIESLEYQLNRDAKEMVINLVANVFANSRLENNNR